MVALLVLVLVVLYSPPWYRQHGGFCWWGIHRNPEVIPRTDNFRTDDQGTAYEPGIQVRNILPKEVFNADHCRLILLSATPISCRYNTNPLSTVTVFVIFLDFYYLSSSSLLLHFLVLVVLLLNPFPLIIILKPIINSSSST